ncbi:hypothetical protein [Streptomyces sp. Y1]|uniref:DUF3558 domain-containing protein n=1 Tax=Streptomyces sp. Y1 TaxID=3238634 RepID=A0AB39TPU2_9ACTN
MTMPPPSPNGPGYGYPQQTPGPAGFGPPQPAAGAAGAGGVAGAPGAAGGSDSGAGRPARGGSLRRNAVWAFVGAVLASGGWAAAVTLVPDLVQSDTSARSVSAFKLSDDFCASGKPQELLRLYKIPDSSPPYKHTDRHANLDTMVCSMTLERNSPSTDDAQYAASYMRADLHKAVNPAPEFAASKDAYRQRNYQLTDIPGLGDEAYFAYLDETGTGGADKTWHNVHAEVNVRDGGMTYFFSWSGSYSEGKTKVPSKEDLRVAMQTDTWATTRSLRT